ncbi:MAG: SCP2 sterol-binding domain-containing protein [Sphingomonadaceae bacterium]|nr:SCP2 sterol-binding domain-containing protein [Sphingomonadaceae bacterium]
MSKTLSLEEVTEIFRAGSKGQPRLGGVLMLDFGEDGCVRIEGHQAPYTIDNQRGDADCTLFVSLSDFSLLHSGELQPQEAIVSERMRMTGAMGLAMKLRDLMED